MSVVTGILKEEESRLEAQLLKYENKLSALPNAAIKKRDNYLYYIRRQGKKVLTEYIGEISGEKSQEALKLDIERKKYKERRKNTIIELKEVRRALGKRAI